MTYSDQFLFTVFNSEFKQSSSLQLEKILKYENKDST